MSNNDRWVAITAMVCLTAMMLIFASCETRVAKYRYGADATTASRPSAPGDAT